MNTTCCNSSNYNTGGIWGTTGNLKWEVCDQCKGWPYQGNAICGGCMGQGGQLVCEPYTILTSDSTTITIGDGISIPAGPQKIQPGIIKTKPLRIQPGDGIDRALRRLEEMKKKVE